MEFEKLKKIIAEVLNVDEEEISMDTTLWMTLELTLWIFSRLLWVLKRNLILKLQMKKQRTLLPFPMQ